MEHEKGLRDLTPDEIAEAISRGVWVFVLEWEVDAVEDDEPWPI